MSLKAMLWALKDAPNVGGTELLVLIVLAEAAGNDGKGAWPSQATIAKYARCTDRQVRNCLAALEAKGLIVRGNQSLVTVGRADRRPVVWDLCLDGLRDFDEPGRPKRGATAKAQESERAEADFPSEEGFRAEVNTPATGSGLPERPEADFRQTVLEPPMNQKRARFERMQAAEPPPSRCARHQTDPAPPPCGACAEQRRARQVWDHFEEEREAETRNARRDAINACARCDANGWCETPDGAVTRCRHDQTGEAA